MKNKYSGALVVTSFLVDLYSALILTKIWGWFIAPWIASYAEVSIVLPFVVALGIILFVKILTYRFTIVEMAATIELSEENSHRCDLTVFLTQFFHVCVSSLTFSIAFVTQFFLM